ISTGQLLDLARDIVAEGISEAPDMRDLQDAARRLDRAARDLRLAVPLKETRVPAPQLLRDAAFKQALDHLADACRGALNVLKIAEERGEGLKNCAARATETVERVQEWIAGDDESLVRWIEAYTHAVALHATPLVVADSFRRQVE